MHWWRYGYSGACRNCLEEDHATLAMGRKGGRARPFRGPWGTQSLGKLTQIESPPPCPYGFYRWLNGDREVQHSLI